MTSLMTRPEAVEIQRRCGDFSRLAQRDDMVTTTAAAPAREVEAVVRSPTNMAAAKISTK